MWHSIDMIGARRINTSVGSGCKQRSDFLIDAQCASVHHLMTIRFWESKEAADLLFYFLFPSSPSICSFCSLACFLDFVVSFDCLAPLSASLHIPSVSLFHRLNPSASWTPRIHARRTSSPCSMSTALLPRRVLYVKPRETRKGKKKAEATTRV